MAEDYYKTLGVGRTATSEEIQKAYRALARKYHPDLNPDDKTAKKKFQEIQNAFDVLGDAAKREKYDRFGSESEQFGGARPGGGRGPSGPPGAEDFDFSQIFGGGSGGFADILNQFRGAGAGGAGPRRARAARRDRGEDVVAEAEIPFQTAIVGGEMQVQVTRGGRVETLTVKIPAGVNEGNKIRLRGQGEPHPLDDAPGDLLLTVHLGPHPFFSRRGNNLVVRLPVTLREAVEGAQVDVPTPHGTVALKVPPGTSSGAKLRVRGHGIAAKGQPPGDLLAEVQIVLPAQLDDRAAEIIRDFDARFPTPGVRDRLRW